MTTMISTTDESGDLFGTMPITRGSARVNGRPPPELVAARALCGQLRRKPAARDKQRIAHLICLNLLSILKHDLQQRRAARFAGQL